MFNFRRPIVWLPLVVPTLFLAACGWRNWRLSNSEEEVWLLIANRFPPAGKKIVPTFSGQEALPQPFHPRQLTVLGMEGSRVGADKPLPVSVFRKIRSIHRGSRIENLPNKPLPTKNWWQVCFGRVKFQGHYQASCSISFTNSKDSLDTVQGGTIILTRSPLPLGSSRWRIVRCEPFPITSG